jgi:hypothetical protein
LDIENHQAINHGSTGLYPVNELKGSPQILLLISHKNPAFETSIYHIEF